MNTESTVKFCNAMGDRNHIPIIDFQCFNVENVNHIDISDQNVQAAAKNLCDAFKNIGFAYLKNHGFCEVELSKLKSLYDAFFDLPLDVKKKHVRRGDGNNGYVPVEMERLNPSRPGDFKEAFNVTPKTMKVWPNAEVPGFEEGVRGFFNKATALAQRVLQAMAIGLQLEDPDFFRKCHNVESSSIANMTALRVLRYPPLDGADIKPNQIRCGEHSDYGSITLVFQDDAGGLEVQGLDGEYKPATPIPGTVIVNLGDLMQQWTADQLKSTKHRVVIPAEEASRKVKRTSVIYFMHPDDDCLIECLDGSNKYPPVTSYQWLVSRFAQTY